MSFELTFEDGTTAEEKKYFVQAYSNVNMVADKRLHCTCCNVHIGTAPNAEKIIRMHPVLRVTQCYKCYRFYNSGEFEKGEDGSELYCRWCGQGGDVYCCSDCPYVFCKKCILRNLTKVALNNVTSNDNWKCFSCAPKILYHLRAQHWALVNFIEKQQKKIEKMRKTHDRDEIADAMSHDSSQCCQTKKKTIDCKKRKPLLYDDSDDDSEDSNWSTKRRSKVAKKSVSESSDVPVVVPVATQKIDKEVPKKKSDPPPPPPKEPQVKKVVPKPTPNVQKTVQPASTPIAPVVANSDAAEIDCTPDLFAYLVNHSYEQTVGEKEQSENSVSSSTGISSTIQGPSTSKNQPTRPAVQSQPQFSNTSDSIRIQSVTSGNEVANAEVSQGQSANREQFVRRVARSTVTQAASQPVYHNYNGYRIDLNSAAQQSTIRLPNGKVIHVKKQTPANNGRNEPTRYSIRDVRPTAPVATAQNQTVTAPASVRHPIQRVPTSTVVRPPGPPPPRTQFAQRMQTIQQQIPPLIINSVSSAGPIPPLQQIPTPAAARMRPQVYQRAISNQMRPHTVPPNHMSFQDAQMHLQQQISMRPSVVSNQVRPNVAVPPAQLPNVTAGPSILNALPQPKVYANDSVGRARTQLERQIFNSISICHQIDGKLKTLMNSNAYKNAQKLHDIKELYIHLSYLFTYTKGRFQTVHDKCMEDMERLGFKNDATSLSSGNVIDKYGSDVDEDDLEIVEPNHQTINLDSDDETRTPEKNKSKTNANTANGSRQSIGTPGEHEVALSNRSGPINTSGLVLDISSSSTEHLECDVDVTSLLQINMNVEEEDDHGELLLSRMNDDVDGIATPPETEEPEILSIENDLKLKSLVTIELKPVENVYPDLMKKALQKMKNSEIVVEDDDKEAEEEQQSDTNSPCQSQDVSEKKDDDVVVVENEQRTENQLETAKNNENELQSNENVDQPPDETEKTADESKQNENQQNEIAAIEEVENETPQIDTVEVENDIEMPQIEATTPQNDADFSENEAKSIESSSDNGDNDTSNQESHAEITSTSMVIDENDVVMLDASNSPNRSDDKTNDDQLENDGNDSNEVSMMDTVNDALIEITTENNEHIETESLFSDLDINSAISTSDTLNVVASILDNNDFENISSPENF
ncbi:uncharacterized protein LOC116337961 isoform X2 [Contarinia nasturtii]|uniref:uncharacterized protein LOC116337961 isoform X2 n=1 Tax=Contarinia nasturtii TaxID=265458 RepID=UPI0012D454D7|nr:uncharacterized protein LOC116337961 isoform X2 [Contarinia nasturtii]